MTVIMLDEKPAYLIEVGLGSVGAGSDSWLVSAVSSDWVILGWACLHLVVSYTLNPKPERVEPNLPKKLLRRLCALHVGSSGFTFGISFFFLLLLLRTVILYIISYHIISDQIRSYHIISHHIISYHIISYHIISYHIISYHIISYHIISDHVMSCHVISYHNVLCKPDRPAGPTMSGTTGFGSMATWWSSWRSPAEWFTVSA